MTASIIYSGMEAGSSPGATSTHSCILNKEQMEQAWEIIQADNAVWMIHSPDTEKYTRIVSYRSLSVDLFFGFFF